MIDPSLEVLISEDRIRAKVAELAARIAADHEGVTDLRLVGVLKGSFIFLADLSRAVATPNSVDFMALSSYGDATVTSGNVRMLLDLRRDIEGRHVVVVEDIVDTGLTLDFLLRQLAARRPASLKTCALVSKPDRRQVEIPIDYLGFEIPDVWVVGYGLDWAERYRTLPFIGVVRPEG